MSGDLNVPYDGLEAAVGRFETLSGDAENMVTLAEDADPDPWTWGLPGLAFCGGYTSSANQLREHLTNVAGSLGAHGERVQNCLDNYRIKEEDNTVIMDEIRSRMDGGEWTP